MHRQWLRLTLKYPASLRRTGYTLVALGLLCAASCLTICPNKIAAGSICVSSICLEILNPKYN